MSKIVTRALGRQAAKHARRRGWFDVRLGVALFRDRRVPVGTKVAALGVGFVGKTFGPIGFLYTALLGGLPWAFGLTILTNDLIWWPAFWSFAFRHAIEPVREAWRTEGE